MKSSSLGGMSRRTFVKSGGLMTMAPLVSAWVPSDGALGPKLGAPARNSWQAIAEAPPPDRARLRQIADRGLEVARAAGAEYADVRMTEMHWVQLSTEVKQPKFGGVGHNFYSRTLMGMGVRALVNGCWGYSSHVTWSPADVIRLAQEAVGAARASTVGPQRTVTLAPVSAVPDGDWQTPITIDPFSIPIDEIMDEMAALGMQAFQHHREVSDAQLRNEMTRDFRAFASTDGTFTTQTLYRIGGDYSVGMEAHWRTRRNGGRFADALSVAGAGWEYVLNAPIREELPRVIEEADRTRFGRDVDIGRFDVVFDARAMSSILAASIGSATDLTRAMGYDANSDGTSFLEEPLTMVGTLKVASPLITITADRTRPGASATVRWDDEGVAPEEFTLVKEGLLSDFQTTRESASWLSDYYVRKGLPVRSHACTGSDSAVQCVLPQQPNLSVQPGPDALGRADLCKDVERGYLVLGGTVKMDHQCITGYISNAVVFEIRNGKVGDSALGAGFLFNTLELWKNIEAVGGAASLRTFNSDEGKSYKQRAMRSMTVPPVRVRNVATVDMRRKGR